MPQDRKDQSLEPLSQSRPNSNLITEPAAALEFHLGHECHRTPDEILAKAKNNIRLSLIENTGGNRWIACLLQSNGAGLVLPARDMRFCPPQHWMQALDEPRRGWLIDLATALNTELGHVGFWVVALKEPETNDDLILLWFDGDGDLQVLIEDVKFTAAEQAAMGTDNYVEKATHAIKYWAETQMDMEFKEGQQVKAALGQQQPN